MSLDAVPRPTSLTESAYEEIRGAILDGEFPPGTPLSVVAVSKALDMSRSPVRGALERIMAEGLLEICDGRFIVAELAPEALFDSMTVRELLEGGAAELAAPRFTPAMVEHLAEIQDQFVRAYEETDARSAMRADLAFHRAVQSLCGNTILIQHLDRLQTSIMVVTYSEKWSAHQNREGIAEHAAILSAIRLRDPILARMAATSHVRSANQRLRLVWATAQAGNMGAKREQEGSALQSTANEG